MTVAELPADLVEASELAREVAKTRGEDSKKVYNRMKLWWTRKRIHSWERGGRVLLSVSEVLRRFQEMERITPRDGEEE